MQPLKQIARDVDTRPILKALHCDEDLWHLDTSRQRNIHVQRQTQSIALRRALRTPENRHLRTEDIHASELAPHAWRIPEAVLLCHALARPLGVELGRAMLVRLPAGGAVAAHQDAGAYYAIRDRFHLAVGNEPGGSILRVSDQEVDLPLGSLWQIDNKQPHSARNYSTAERIHLIFDVLPRRGDRPIEYPTGR